MWDTLAAQQFANKVSIVISLVIVFIIVIQFRFTRHD